MEIKNHLFLHKMKEFADLIFLNKTWFADVENVVIGAERL